eukprot:221944_1
MWFLSSLGTLNDIDAITITSIVLYVLSVLIAVLSMLTERNIAQTQGYATIAMKITGHAVTSGSNPMKCKTLKRVLAEPRVHCSAVEVLKPTPINQGFEWNVNFYFGDDNKKTIDYHQIFLYANATHELPELFERSWGLSGKPNIQDIIVQSMM